MKKRKHTMEKVMDFIIRSFVSVIIIFGIIIMVTIVVGKTLIDEVTCDGEEKIVEDIIQISPGGFGSSTACILQVEGKKITTVGSNCYQQIGEVVCLK